MPNLKKIIISTILLLIIVISVGWDIYANRTDIFKHFDSNYWTKRYQASQWVNPISKNSIGDDGLYMYAGYAYLHGTDPTLLNAEMPPLGKYIIGIFETTTGYIGAVSVFFGIMSLAFLYLLNRVLFKSSILALVPVALFSLEPLFLEQLRAPFLDTMYLSFFLFTVLLFLRKNYLFSAVSAGLFMSIKSPFEIVLLYAVMIGFLITSKAFTLKRIFIMLILTAITYCITYLPTFLHGYNFLYFLKVQKYIYHFYATGAKGVVGAVVPMLISGNWFTWWGQTISVGEWNILWPLGFIFLPLSLIHAAHNRKDPMVTLVFWSVVYLAFLCITPIFARYLLLLLPFLYNGSIWVLSKNSALKSLLQRFLS